MTVPLITVACRRKWKMKTKLPAFLALVILAPLARAHDFWIEPSTFSPPVGSTVQLGLRVGEHFDGEPVPRNSAKIESFIVAGPSGERQVPGRDGVDPAGMGEIESAGVHLVGYRSKRSFIELEAAKFEAYLKEGPGLDHRGPRQALRVEQAGEGSVLTLREMPPVGRYARRFRLRQTARPGARVDPRKEPGVARRGSKGESRASDTQVRTRGASE